MQLLDVWLIDPFVLQQQLDNKEDLLRELIAEGKRTALKGEEREEEVRRMHTDLREGKNRENASSARIVAMEQSLLTLNAEKGKAEQALAALRENSEAADAVHATVLAEHKSQLNDLISTLEAADKQHNAVLLVSCFKGGCEIV